MKRKATKTSAKRTKKAAPKVQRRAKARRASSSDTTTYVDGYILPIPRSKVKDYAKIANKAGKIWREHGALDYKECVGDDLKAKGVVPFQRSVKTKSNETVVFSYVVFKSKEHRNEVNAKVMSDPRMARMCKQPMPFDVKRMVYGGFRVVAGA